MASAIFIVWLCQKKNHCLAQYSGGKQHILMALHILRNILILEIHEHTSGGKSFYDLCELIWFSSLHISVWCVLI